MKTDSSLLYLFFGGPNSLFFRTRKGGFLALLDLARIAHFGLTSPPQRPPGGAGLPWSGVALARDQAQALRGFFPRSRTTRKGALMQTGGFAVPAVDGKRQQILHRYQGAGGAWSTCPISTCFI